MYYLCTYNYTKGYTDRHADTRTYRQAHCRQSHTDRHLPWAIHCTDWLYATCVDYSKSRINDIYTEVISFFSVVIDTYLSQFMVNVDSSPLIFDLFVSILHLIVSCWRKQERIAEHFVFVFVYIVLAWIITQSQDCVSFMYVSIPKKYMVFSKFYIYCCMNFIQSIWVFLQFL